MKIAGHYDGKVVVLDEPVVLATGTKVVVSVSAESVEAPLERDPVSGLFFQRGDPSAMARVLRELAEDKDNPWRDVGENYAAELRARSNGPRYSL